MVTPAEAARVPPHLIIGSPAYYAYDLDRRRRARKSLPAFATSIEIPNVPAESSGPSDDDDPDKIEEGDVEFPSIIRPKLVAHHQLICEAFQATVDGTATVGGQPLNLMLLLPPGSAKSTYADIVGVPWFMATRPQGLGNVLLASHSSELAARQGRRARQVVRSKLFTSIFPLATLPAKGAADNWILANGAEFLAGGILSGITGSRCSLGIADDLIRGREAAQSQRIRDKTWEAYSDDFCSRLLPGASQILITTRWHQDDPAGRILPDKWAGESGIILGRDGRWWNVICVPAIADRIDDPLGRKIGEGLWPEWFKTGHWEPFKKNQRTWTSLYQQKPSAPEGTFFRRAWFDGGLDEGKVIPSARYAVRPTNLNIYLTSDHASSDDDGDYTILRIWGIDAQRHVYWLDGWRGQTNTGVWIGQGLALIKKYKPLCWFPEKDAIWRSVEPLVKTQMRDSQIVCRIAPLSAQGDKTDKAQSFQGMASLGMVHLPAGSTEANEAIEEYVAFPTGPHDDEVDVGSNICRALMDAHPAIVQTAAPKARTDPWGNPLAESTDWRTA